MPPESPRDWKRLGRLLAERRVQIAPRYENKALFSTERNLNTRMLWRIETGADDTYRPKTIDNIEDAYMLVRGSLLRTVAGGELEPLPVPSAVPDAPRLVPPAPGVLPPGYREPERDLASYLFADDPVKRLVWRASRTQTDEERLQLLLEIDADRRSESGNPGAAGENDDGGHFASALHRRPSKSRLHNAQMCR